MALLGRSALVVGGTGGIGKGIALTLATRGCDVLVAGRSETEGLKVIEECRRRNEKGSHQFLSVDASLIGNVDKFTTKLKNGKENLDFLVLSQGIASLSGFSPTKEGLDVKMSLHFYSRMRFIMNLLPLLRKSQEGAAVLSVLSAGVHKPYTDKNDLSLEKTYSLGNAANAAGFYNDLVLDKLSKMEDNSRISFLHAAPGMVATNWGSEFPFPLRAMVRGLQALLAKSPEECGDIMVSAMLAPKRRSGGFHLVNEKGEDASRTDAHSSEYVDAVWNHLIEKLDDASKRQ